MWILWTNINNIKNVKIKAVQYLSWPAGGVSVTPAVPVFTCRRRSSLNLLELLLCDWLILAVPALRWPHQWLFVSFLKVSTVELISVSLLFYFDGLLAHFLPVVGSQVNLPASVWSDNNSNLQQFLCSVILKQLNIFIQHQVSKILTFISEL